MYWHTSLEQLHLNSERKRLEFSSTQTHRRLRFIPNAVHPNQRAAIKLSVSDFCSMRFLPFSQTHLCRMEYSRYGNLSLNLADTGHFSNQTYRRHCWSWLPCLYGSSVCDDVILRWSDATANMSDNST